MQLTLSERKEIAPGTQAIWFRPANPLQFAAGQFGEFKLIDPPRTDAKGNTRTFSIANAPGQEQIMIATRMSESAFKESLNTAPIGTVVQFMGPMGSFTLHKDASRPAVFLTGGIGITPVRSIVEHAIAEGSEHELFVFYSNRTRASAAFLQEFRDWGESHSHLIFIPTLTDEAREAESFEQGFIDARMLSRYLPEPRLPIYYLVGPPEMVAAMRRMLEEFGIDELQIKSEDFLGY